MFLKCSSKWFRCSALSELLIHNEYFYFIIGKISSKLDCFLREWMWLPSFRNHHTSLETYCVGVKIIKLPKSFPKLLIFSAEIHWLWIVTANSLPPANEVCRHPPSGQTPPGRHPPGQTPSRQIPPSRHPLGRHPPGRHPRGYYGIQSTSVRYASHWNTFLF